MGVLQHFGQIVFENLQCLTFDKGKKVCTLLLLLLLILRFIFGIVAFIQTVELERELEVRQGVGDFKSVI